MHTVQDNRKHKDVALGSLREKLLIWWENDSSVSWKDKICVSFCRWGYMNLNLDFAHLSPDWTPCKTAEEWTPFISEPFKKKTSAEMKNRRWRKWREKKTVTVGTDPKKRQQVFFDTKSIQTAVQSSILLALFAGELGIEIQFQNTRLDSVLKSQTNHRNGGGRNFSAWVLLKKFVLLCRCHLDTSNNVYTSELLLL